MLCSWRVNIKNGMATPHNRAMATSSHQRVATKGTICSPQRATPNNRKPLMIVARPMGMVPKNMDTVEWPKMRRASSKKNSQRARYNTLNTTKSAMVSSHKASANAQSMGTAS
ncbi:hypothetical protein D3C76_1666920 [compost metagenome]